MSSLGTTKALSKHYLTFCSGVKPKKSSFWFSVCGEVQYRSSLRGHLPGSQKTRRLPSKRFSIKQKKPGLVHTLVPRGSRAHWTRRACLKCWITPPENHECIDILGRTKGASTGSVHLSSNGPRPAVHTGRRGSGIFVAQINFFRGEAP